MTRRDRMQANLLALTKARTIQQALKKWKVEERIDLRSEVGSIPCKLCGTRFSRGAWVSHPRAGATIPVGGTCIKALLLGVFPEPGVTHPKRSDLRKAIREAYSDWIAPGDWINWILLHAPRTLEREKVELDQGIALATKGLKKLIAFHDSNCEYPLESLFDDVRFLPKDVRRKGSTTLNDARQLASVLSSGERGLAMAEAKLRCYVKEHESSWMQGDSGPWRRLDADGRRVVAAVQMLAEKQRDLPSKNPICSDKLASRWPRLEPHRRDVFCWHPRLGAAHIEPEEGDFWMTHSGEYKIIGDRSKWLSVSGAPRDAVQQLIHLAFPVEFKLWPRD